MSHDPKPRIRVLTREQELAVLSSRAELVSRSLKSHAFAQHGILAELSHMARVAAERLEAGALGQGVGLSEIPTGELQRVLAIMREVQNLGHVAYLQRHGAEDDFQAVGRKVAKRLSTPRRGKAARLPEP